MLDKHRKWSGRTACIVTLLAASFELLASSPAQAADGAQAGKATQAGKAPQAEDAARGARAFAGRTYSGFVSARVRPPKGSGARALNRRGRSTAEFQVTGKDTATLLLIGNVEKDNDASFAAEGRFIGADWQGGQAVPVTISGNGRIAGGGTKDGSRMRIEGRFEGDELQVLVELRPLSATPGGFPVGTVFRFEYTLAHAKPRAHSEGAGKNDRCREIVYRTQLIPNLFGSSMSMIRVPECRR